MSFCTVYEPELQNGLYDVNKHLWDICAGNGSVRFGSNWDWIERPGDNILEYTVVGNPPQEAIDAAEFVKRKWSHAPIRTMRPERDDVGLVWYGQYGTVDLWRDWERYVANLKDN